MSVKKPVIAGNWKMNHAPRATREFFADFLHRYSPRLDRTVIFFPPALSLPAAREVLTQRDDVALGVQNIHWEESGAFTGEISAPMSRDAGAEFALVGHSERRHHFGETEEETLRKVAAALAAGLAPVLCVGETLEEREGDRAQEVVQRQLDAVVTQLPQGDASRLLLAYEPVWAIGTGRTASPEDAQQMHRFIRDQLSTRCGDDVADRVAILYGGSVKPANAAELLDRDDIDGVLVGGASLEAESFHRICTASG